MPLRILYGGTFDPVHLGHLAIARAARDQLQVAVRLMPAADPPHRVPPGANAEQRARMLELAIGDEPGLLVDRREIDRAQQHPGVPSYTVDTLRALRAELGPLQPLAWLVGADSLRSLNQWHEWKDLFGLCHFIVAERMGSPMQAGLAPELAVALHGRHVNDERPLFSTPGGRILRLRAPLRGESATAVRELIAQNGAWRNLLPEPVADYIVDHRLYGADGA